MLTRRSFPLQAKKLNCKQKSASCKQKCSNYKQETPKHNFTSKNSTVNKLKTTPTPNKNGLYGIEGGGFVRHKRRSSYAIKVGSCTTFSVKVPLFQGIFTPYVPSFYGIFSGSYFLLIWGVGVVRIMFTLSAGSFQSKTEMYPVYASGAFLQSPDPSPNTG